MCLFCCDMLCWFSLITCCGCRDMVTRRLVFFPPEPYYDQVRRQEKFEDFYTRLHSCDTAAEQKEDIEHDAEADADGDGDVVLEVGAGATNTANHRANKPSTTAMTTTSTHALRHEHDQSPPSTKRLTSNSRSRDTPKNAKLKKTFGTFRIRDDVANLARFYTLNYNLDMKHFRSQYLVTRRGQQIASYYIRNPRAQYTILFSHGNAADIGIMRNHLCRMYQKCNVSIFAYEYSGYGQSSGKPSESNTYADIEAAYHYCRHELNIPAYRLIAYGQSLGTCVSVYLASRFPVAGVVLHSPLMSGLRVMQHFDKTYWFDIYPVVEQIQQVFAPLFVIHGNYDKEIDVIHGKILSRIAPNAYPPWFVPYAGHNDIEVKFPEVLFHKVSKFVRHLKTLEEAYLNKQPGAFAADDGDDDTRLKHGQKREYKQDEDDEDEEEEDDDDDAEDADEDEEEDTAMARVNRMYAAKSTTHKNTDLSISPPPPQSVLTKSERVMMDSVGSAKMRAMTLPSRKFSATNNSTIEDEESVLKTPSVATSLSMKDSNLVSSLKEDKSGNKHYDTVLTPTMRTIHSKEQSTSEMFTLDKHYNLDESQTQSAAKHKVSRSQQQRKTRKKHNMVSSQPHHPGIDEYDEQKNDLLYDRSRYKSVSRPPSKSHKPRDRHKQQQNTKRLKTKKSKKSNLKRLVLPTSTRMTQNIDECYRRRDRVRLDEYEDVSTSLSSSSSSSSESSSNDSPSSMEDVPEAKSKFTGDQQKQLRGKPNNKNNNNNDSSIDILDIDLRELDDLDMDLESDENEANKSAAKK